LELPLERLDPPLRLRQLARRGKLGLFCRQVLSEELLSLLEGLPLETIDADGKTSDHRVGHDDELSHRDDIGERPDATSVAEHEGIRIRRQLRHAKRRVRQGEIGAGPADHHPSDSDRVLGIRGPPAPR
jgi:hypothetical protein